MTVQCWVRDAELKQFVREKCGVETLTAKHRLQKFRMNEQGDVFLTFEPYAGFKEIKPPRKKHK